MKLIEIRLGKIVNLIYLICYIFRTWNIFIRNIHLVCNTLSLQNSPNGRTNRPEYSDRFGKLKAATVTCNTCVIKNSALCRVGWQHDHRAWQHCRRPHHTAATASHYQRKFTTEYRPKVLTVLYLCMWYWLLTDLWHLSCYKNGLLEREW